MSGLRVVLPEGKLIAPWSEKVRYGGKRNGYHGGASPQECVVPLAVIGWPSPLPKDYEALPTYEPEWWLIRGVEPVPITPLETATSLPKPVYSAKGQAEILFGGRTGPQTWIDTLIASPIFARQVVVAGRSAPPPERIRQFLSALEERGGTILRKAPAQKLG